MGEDFGYPLFPSEVELLINLWNEPFVYGRRPLRERMEDIPLLALFLTEKVSKGVGKSIVQIPHSIIKTMQDYP